MRQDIIDSIESRLEIGDPDRSLDLAELYDQAFACAVTPAGRDRLGHRALGR